MWVSHQAPQSPSPLFSFDLTSPLDRVMASSLYFVETITSPQLQ